MKTSGEKIPVSQEKLLAELKKRGVLSLNQVAHEMGHANSYLSKMFREGGFTKPVSVFLQLKYVLSPEDYAPDNAEQNNSPIDYVQIYNTVLAATKDAIKQETPKEPQMKIDTTDLCQACYYKFRTRHFIRQLSAASDYKVHCRSCGKANTFGVTIEYVKNYES